MARSILTICRSVLDEVGGDDLDSLTGDRAQEAAPLMLALANKIGDELARFGEPPGGWPFLRAVHSIRQPAGASGDLHTDITLPDDYVRPGDAPWLDRWRSQGPVNAAWEAMYLAEPGYYTTSLGGWWRIARGSSGGVVLRLIPALNRETEIRFDYLSGNWCQSSGGAAKAELDADTDEVFFDEWLFRIGLLAEFKRNQEIADWQQDRATFEQERRQRYAESRGTSIIDVGFEGSGGTDPWTSLPIPTRSPG